MTAPGVEVTPLKVIISPARASLSATVILPSLVGTPSTRMTTSATGGGGAAATFTTTAVVAELPAASVTIKRTDDVPSGKRVTNCEFAPDCTGDVASPTNQA